MIRSLKCFLLSLENLFGHCCEIPPLLFQLSGLLDAVDGHAARLLDQSSKFGAMLDMLTDRCATMCLLATLCIFYPSAAILFQISMTIDISCHWIHMHTTLLKVYI